jgi:hypothetical protein
MSTNRGTLRTTKATRARKLMGSSTDKMILQMVNRQPGASLYEIARVSHSSVGMVDGSIQRLEKKGRVKIKHVLRGGRSLKEVFPSSFEMPSSERIKLDVQAFSFPSTWKDAAYIYPLNRISVGISPTKEKDWGSKALFEMEIPIKREDNSESILIEFPEILRSFYLSENSVMDLTVIGNRALVNFTTEIQIQ